MAMPAAMNPTRRDREFRLFTDFELRSEGEDSKKLYVEGYAARFNEPTVLWEYDGIQYKEQIDPGAFTDADLSDVIFVYNHSGKVMARTRNKTLQLTIDSKGLHIRARLDGTAEGREMYEMIRGKYVDRMSFAFSVKESSYDRDERMRTITKVKKVYDVSAVNFPAYDTATISARSFFEAQRDLELLEADRRRRLLLLTQL